jgi:two-component system, NtrC family, response regulator AtoC
LRAVETHEVQPVGSSQSYQVDLRLVAATNRDLRAMVKAGQFRDDLYYRLSAMAVEMPPLRARRDAIEALAAHFVAHYNRLFDKQVRFISRRALAALKAYQWPGNVREFAHAIQSAVMLTDDERIDLVNLPHIVSDTVAAEAIEEPDNSDVTEKAEMVSAPDRPRRFLLDEVISLASKGALLRALHETSGNCYRAAQLLGVSRYTVYRMIARYGLGPNRIRRSADLHVLSGANGN